MVAFKVSTKVKPRIVVNQIIKPEVFAAVRFLRRATPINMHSCKGCFIAEGCI